MTEAEEWTLHTLDAHIRRRLRAIKLKHWRKRRTIARRLIRLGIKAYTAWNLVYRRGKSWWALSSAFPVNKALSNTWFHERGLFSLKEHWREYRAQSVIGPDQLKLDLG